MNNKDLNQSDRRQFLKIAGAFTVMNTIGKGGEKVVTNSSTDGFVIPSCVNTDVREYHVCMGLNMKTVSDSAGKSYPPGTAPGPTLKTQDDLHECKGGNTCAGLAGCGTGTYERQYWIADNICARESAASWTGSGGCGVPIGYGNSGFITTQLNGAPPTSCADLNKTGKAECYDDEGNPMDTCSKYSDAFLAEPVWNIARARFEAKMRLHAEKDPANADNYAFGVPDGLSESSAKGILQAGTLTVDPTTKKPTYAPPAKVIPPYPLPIPPRYTAGATPTLKKCNAASKVDSSVTNPK